MGLIVELGERENGNTKILLTMLFFLTSIYAKIFTVFYLNMLFDVNGDKHDFPRFFHFEMSQVGSGI